MYATKNDYDGDAIATKPSDAPRYHQYHYEKSKLDESQRQGMINSNVYTRGRFESKIQNT
jgi:hypothetical protein